MKNFETTGVLKPFHQIDREAAFTSESPSGSNIKIYHPAYFPGGDGTVYGEGATARQEARLVAESGSKKGYLGIHSDYRSMFGRKVTIRPKYYSNGLVNKHQCLVVGNRNKERIAFTAYDCWFESFAPMVELKDYHIRQMEPSPGIDITRASWDQLFDI